MKDMMISLAGTGVVAPLMMAYVMGWSWTKDVLVSLVTLLAVVRWSIDRFFNSCARRCE